MATVRLATELPVRTASNACPPSWIKVTKILNGYVRIPANGMNHKAMDRRTAKNRSLACGRASVLILYLILLTLQIGSLYPIIILAFYDQTVLEESLTVVDKRLRA